MGTAVEWEREHAEDLQAIKDAVANKDPYLAIEILNRIAPVHEGDDVREPANAGEAIHNRVLEVVDPATGRLHNEYGPAVVKADGTRKWYRKGMQHNASGPAVIKANGELKYYYLGTKCKNAEDLDDIVRRAQEHAQRSKNLRNVA